jgi:hypothetical protein
MRKKGTNICQEGKVNVYNTINTIVMIQTNKPIYKPNERLKYQIVALDVNTKPVELKELDVEILDGEKNQVFAEKITTIEKSKFGFYQGEFDIGEEPKEGSWTIKVKVNGKEMYTEKSFAVKPYVLPTFSVDIEAPLAISILKKKLKFKVSSIYSLDKPVKGKAGGFVKVFADQERTDEINSFELASVDSGQNGASFEVNFKNNLELNFIAMNFYIMLDLWFEEEISGVRVEGSKVVLLIPDGKHNINLNHPKGFKPEFDFTIKATVRTRDGQLEKSTTLPFTINYEFGFPKKPKVPVRSTFTTYLKNGVGLITIKPPINANKIDYKISYDETKMTGSIGLHASSSNDEFIQISMLNET